MRIILTDTSNHFMIQPFPTSKAVGNINTTINEALKGIDASDIYAVDGAMLAADGTKDKSNLGANAILAVSIAAVRAAATA